MEEIKSIGKKIVTEKDLKRIREENKNKKIVLCVGSFDVLHSGHIVFFNQCKKQGDILVVGVGRDSIIRKYKGSNRPIISEKNRLFHIAALQDVDYVVLDQDVLEKDEIDYRETLELLRPDVFCINDDNKNLDINKGICDEFGVEFMVLKRDLPGYLPSISTTDIIKKIKDL